MLTILLDAALVLVGGFISLDGCAVLRLILSQPGS